jgi:PHD/YefM family antitoxin component YafN of YafNO toxin-antitoxin module
MKSTTFKAVMRQVNSTDFKRYFDDFVDLVREAPIEVMRGSKAVGVFLSREEYEHLQRLDEAYWAARAAAAEARGEWVGHDEAVRILTEGLKRSE